MRDWKMNCSKSIGLSHIQRNIPCQDDCLIKESNNVNVIALSDGCGSSSISEIGSNIVVNFICEYLCNNFDELYNLKEIEIKKEITNKLMDEYDKYLSLQNSKIVNYLKTIESRNNYNNLLNFEIAEHLTKDELNRIYSHMILDATVLFIAVKDNRLILGHCGDGYILGIYNKKLKILSEEIKSGESNETTYPSTILAFEKAYKDESIWNDFRIIKESSIPFTGFILMTDGCENTLIKKNGKKKTPHLNNNSILFEIVNNETFDDAKAYLNDIIENNYKTHLNNYGEQVEITSDDVSVSIMVDPNFSIEDIEVNDSDAKKIVVENIEVEEKHKKFIKTRFTTVKKQRLLALLSYGTSMFNEDKFDWLRESLSLLIEGLDEKSIPFDGIREYIADNSNYPIIEDIDFEEIIKYARLLNILDKNNNRI